MTFLIDEINNICVINHICIHIYIRSLLNNNSIYFIKMLDTMVKNKACSKVI